MGLISYNGEEKKIVFRCSGCEERGSDPIRTIDEDDTELVEGDGFAGVMLPLCSCGARSYLLPGHEVKGPINHLRAVLFNRRYKAAGGDANPDLAKHRVFIEALSASYAKDATRDAKDEFDGKKNFGKADKTVKPLKGKDKPVDE